MSGGALALSERFERGRRLRDRVPRVAHGAWEPTTHRLDVVADFRLSNAGRLPPLVALKAKRMADSAFGYFRGSALRMAQDLAGRPAVGPLVQICGDAHAQNVGAYAAADGHLTFDLNDFDETSLGPWEWDLKRFATSLVLAGREACDRERRCSDAVRALSRSYREHMRKLARMPYLDVIRYKVRRASNDVVRDVLAKAERAEPQRYVSRLTISDPRGGRKFHDRPPTLRPVPAEVADAVLRSFGEYRRSLPIHRRRVLDVYRPADVAFRVGGLGALGLRNYLVLLQGPTETDALILQIKQAVPSVIQRSLTRRRAVGHQGRRIAEGQATMQTGTDPLVGWTTVGRDQFVVRQLSDYKAKLEPSDLIGRPLELLGEVAGELLAKAHARTGDAAVIAGYCGRSERLDEALVAFAHVYADQTESDHRDFRRARRRGDL